MTSLTIKLSHASFLTETLLLQALTARGHTVAVHRDLKRHVENDVLPDRAVQVSTVVHGPHHRDVLVRVDDTLVLLDVSRSSASLWVTASDLDAANRIADEVHARVTWVPDPRRVEVVFCDQQTGSRALELDVRPWSEVDGHYPEPVRRALDPLFDHTPEAGTAQRLLLWHGAPGTGKTSAVRALVHAWRDWCEPVVVSDPDALLKDGRYLRRMVLDETDDEEHWRLFVLEDADSLLHQAGGAALSTLLNLADGLLGQGLRCLFLLTTNTPVDAMHPALVRPGRCLSRVEFTALPPERASLLLGRPVLRAMTLAEVMAGPTLTAVAPTVAVGQYL